MLEHGGNLAQAASEYNLPINQWLDLSTGINPNGYPVTTLENASWQRLPIENDGLIEAARRYYGCKFVLPTPGSQGAIQVLPQLRPPSKVAMPRIMYQEHSKAWKQHGHEILEFELDTLPDLHKSVDVVLLCNPNNPTASQYPADKLLQLHEQLRKKNGWLIVDEAFLDTEPERSVAKYAHVDGLLVLKSLGKFFGLAGARVGFLIGADKMIGNVHEKLGPWAVSGPSRAVAIKALNDEQWQKQAICDLKISSKRLGNLLTKYGFAPTGSTDFFHFVRVSEAAQLRDYFAKQGIWVRFFKEASALRFGLPDNSGWERLEKALEAVKC